MDKGIALSAIVALGAEKQQFPSAAFWAKTTLLGAAWIVPALLVVAAVFSLGPLTSRAESHLISSRTGLQRQILSTLGQMLTGLEAQLARFDHSDVGLHIWKLRRRGRAAFRPRLQRIATYRLGGSVNLRDFQPRKGEGVVGLCWAKNEEVKFDVAALARRLTDSKVFQREVTTNGPQSVMGFTWEEFVTVRHRGAVLASPIRDKRGRFRGCVSLDLSDNFELLIKSGADSRLNELAELLSGHGFEEM
ncbi:MAG: hypothetical protein ABI568_01055 [Pseudarthrobacter sp.]